MNGQEWKMKNTKKGKRRKKERKEKGKKDCESGKKKVVFHSFLHPFSGIEVRLFLSPTFIYIMSLLDFLHYLRPSFFLPLPLSLSSVSLSLCCFSKNNSLKGEGVLSSIFRASLYFFLSFISLIAIILMVMPFLSFSCSHFVLSSLSHSFLFSSTNSLLLFLFLMTVMMMVLLKQHHDPVTNK